MHTLMKITMNDMYTANSSITSGKLQTIMQKLTQQISPQTSFFYTENGFRTAIFIFDMKESAMIPQIAEPIFTGLNAKVEFFPGMDPKELNQGLSNFQKQNKESGVNQNLS